MSSRGKRGTQNVVVTERYEAVVCSKGVHLQKCGACIELFGLWGQSATVEPVTSLLVNALGQK